MAGICFSLKAACSWYLSRFPSIPQHITLSHSSLFSSFPEAAPQGLVKGQVGGNVTIRCPVNKEKTIQFFYLQKDNTFVNGFHTLREIPTQRWENTRLDNNSKTAVLMFNLNITHSGDYKCIINYSDSDQHDTTVIQLSVTGECVQFII